MILKVQSGADCAFSFVKIFLAYSVYKYFLIKSRTFYIIKIRLVYKKTTDFYERVNYVQCSCS